jgi:hypothetical protein
LLAFFTAAGWRGAKSFHEDSVCKPPDCLQTTVLPADGWCAELTPKARWLCRPAPWLTASLPASVTSTRKSPT